MMTWNDYDPGVPKELEPLDPKPILIQKNTLLAEARLTRDWAYGDGITSTTQDLMNMINKLITFIDINVK